MVTRWGLGYTPSYGRSVVPKTYRRVGPSCESKSRLLCTCIHSPNRVHIHTCTQTYTRTYVHTHTLSYLTFTCITCLHVYIRSIRIERSVCLNRTVNTFDTRLSIKHVIKEKIVHLVFNGWKKTFPGQWHTPKTWYSTDNVDESTGNVSFSSESVVYLFTRTNTRLFWNKYVWL